MLVACSEVLLRSDKSLHHSLQSRLVRKGPTFSIPEPLGCATGLPLRVSIGAGHMYLLTERRRMRTCRIALFFSRYAAPSAC